MRRLEKHSLRTAALFIHTQLTNYVTADTDVLALRKEKSCCCVLLTFQFSVYVRTYVLIVNGFCRLGDLNIWMCPAWISHSIVCCLWETAQVESECVQVKVKVLASAHLPLLRGQHQPLLLHASPHIFSSRLHGWRGATGAESPFLFTTPHFSRLPFVLGLSRYLYEITHLKRLKKQLQLHKYAYLALITVVRCNSFLSCKFQTLVSRVLNLGVAEEVKFVR